MNRLIRNLTSLCNLAPGKRPAGQMATLLILVTVMLLIFVLVTLNIGQIAINRTTLSNAADSASLYMASQLATKARQLYEGLGNQTSQCQKTGFANIFLAIIIAIVAIVATIFTFGGAAVGFVAMLQLTVQTIGTTGLMVAGAVGGAIGGALGGAISGTGAGQGALLGASIGAAIGGIAGSIGSMLSAGSSVATNTSVQAGGQGATISTSGGNISLASGESVSLLSSGTITQGSAVVTSTAAANAGGFGSALAGMGVSGAGGASLGALTLGSAGYNEVSAQDMRGKVIDKILAMLSKGSERDRIREMAFMRALQQVVDDPNFSQDTNDSNANGDTREFVPAFQTWLYERAIGVGLGETANISYLTVALAQLKDMADFLATFYQGTDTNGYHVPGYFEAAEYRWVYNAASGEDGIIDNGASAGDFSNDGIFAQVFRALEQHGYFVYNVSGQKSYISGPAFADYKAYLDEPCCGNDCGAMPPAVESTFDEFDGITSGIREAVVFIDGLMAQPAEDRNATWSSWVTFLYDPGYDESPDPYGNPSGTFYGLFTEYCATVAKWRRDVDALVPTLPTCAAGSDGDFVNAPCKISRESGFYPEQDGQDINYYFSNRWGASFSGMPRDEYADFYNWSGAAYNTLKGMRDKFKEIYDNLDSASGALRDRGGTNPVRYSWGDLRGEHWVEVRVGNFRLPKIEKKKYGNWWKGRTCMELRDYDEASQSPENYIQVRRYDQSKNMGFLGRWNPFNTVTKRSYYYYTCMGGDGSRPGQVGIKE